MDITNGVHMKITLKNISNPDFVDEQLENEPRGMATMELTDGSFEVPIRRALLTAHLMKPMIGRVPITSEFIYTEEKFNTKGITKLYNRIADAWSVRSPRKSKVEKELRAFQIDIAMNIDGLNNLALEHMQGYQDSFDLVDICRMMEQKPLKELCDNLKLDNNEGTKVAEKKIAMAGKELGRILRAGTDVIDFNPLYPHIEYINMNQLIQILISYGPRSDIDDSMLSHVVKGNALDGLMDFDDFYTEAHSAKKSAWVSKGAIKEAQYNSRKVQLACFELIHMVAGDCNTTVTIQMIIAPEIKHNFIGKFVDTGDSGRGILLTEDNIDDFLNKPIKLYSAFGCKVKNGVCEHCFGKAGQAIQKAIHIGILCASIVLSAITQKILSAKHLVRTASQMYKLPNELKSLFITNYSKEQGTYKYTDEELKEQITAFAKVEGSDDEDEDGIDELVRGEMDVDTYRSLIENEVINDTEVFWRPAHERYLQSGLKLIIPLDVFNGVLSDIALDPVAKSFTTIRELAIHNDSMRSPLPLKFIGDDKDNSVYFSKYTLEFIHDRVTRELVTIPNNKVIHVPLAGFDITKAFVISPTINIDVVKFVAHVNSFLQSKLPKYTSATEGLTDFLNLVYRESTVPVSHVEVVLKAFTITSSEDKRIPVITDPNNMVFANTNDTISRTASGKMSYEDLNRYYARPDTYLAEPAVGLVDPLFGSIERIVDK